MSRILIIAEKPSVATDLARVLGKLPEFGKFTKQKDYFENDNAFISSAVGHLVELKMPLTPEGKKLPWSMKHLPVIPDHFELQPIERNEARFNLLVRLLKKKDVDIVVNACDAGREGELIFQYVLQLADVGKPLTIKRMWMQSMTDGAIMKAWNELRAESEMRNLSDAAMCRSESDWLIGLNGTRALTAFNSRNGGFNVTTAGRVQTPTLAILAERERAIRAFVSQVYWEIHGTFGVEKGEYAGRWFREDFKKDEEDNQKKQERIWSQEEAEAVVARCQGKSGVVEETQKPQKQAPERLFDLTSLQREAGSKHGFSAQRTLQLAQALYDKHKLLTYPRTDSRYLPEDYVDTVKETVAQVAGAKASANMDAGFPGYAQWVIDNDAITPTKRVFDTKKVSDHFAIIPTGNLPTAKLDDAAKKLYELVLRRFLAIFYPHAEYELTSRVTRIGEDCFKTDGRVLVVPGWLTVYGRKPGVAGDKDELVAAKDGESAQAATIESQQKDTKPPARYNDSSLLSAMETAGKLVEDEELREAMSDRGLGTPATRANIIEGLIRQKYMFRHEQNYRDLVVSNKGLALFEQLETIGIDTLQSPEMTGEWEHKLKLIEKGQLNRADFMEEIKDQAKDIVAQVKSHTKVLVNRTFPDLDAKCPECGGKSMTQTEGLFECKDPECSFRLKKHIASHEISEAEARELITNLKVGPIDTFKNRFGAQFAAELELEKPKKAWKVKFVFEGDSEREDELKNLSDDQLLCECPVSDGATKLVKVYETEKAYIAPGMALAKDERGVRLSKMILQKEIDSQQAFKLFMEGKTDLLPDFVSKKKNRKFAAHLTLDRETGKIGFEFAPQKKKAVKKKTSTKDADAETSEESEAEVAPRKKTAQKKKPTEKSAKKKTAKKKPTKKKPKDTEQNED
jgi:DNA topoisomerase III